MVALLEDQQDVNARLSELLNEGQSLEQATAQLHTKEGVSLPLLLTAIMHLQGMDRQQTMDFLGKALPAHHY